MNSYERLVIAVIVMIISTLPVLAGDNNGSANKMHHAPIECGAVLGDEIAITIGPVLPDKSERHLYDQSLGIVVLQSLNGNKDHYVIQSRGVFRYRGMLPYDVAELLGDPTRSFPDVDNSSFFSSDFRIYGDLPEDLLPKLNGSKFNVLKTLIDHFHGNRAFAINIFSDQDEGGYGEITQMSEEGFILREIRSAKSQEPRAQRKLSRETVNSASFIEVVALGEETL